MAQDDVRQGPRSSILSRRRFLELAAVMSGVAVATACSAPAPSAPAATSAPAPAATKPPAAPAAPAATAPAVSKPADPAPQPTTAAAAPKPAPAAGAGETPVRGGAFRIAFAGAPDFIDPFKTFQGEGYAVSGHIFDNLTQLDQDNQPQPMLATKWTPEKNGQEWVVELRQGVKFHHGKELTSEDVVATLDLGQDSKSALRTVNAFGPYQGVKAEGKYTVRIILSQPFADFPIAAAGAQGRIAPSDRLDSIGTEPVGTGPFKLKDFQQGSIATLVRNPDYWMQGKPYLDELRIVTIKEATARMAALQSGSIDAIFETSATVHQQLEKAPNVKTFSIETGSHQLIQMQANMEPFTRPEVRNAFKYILDREPLVKSLLLGNGTVGNDHPLIASSPFYTDKPQNKRDLEKAKGLLAQAGVTNLNLELWTSSERPPSEKLAVAFKELAAPAGITVEIKDVPQAVYSAEVSKKKPLYTVNRFGRATLYEQIFLWYHGSAGFNYSGVSLSTKLDRLLEDMAAETDIAKRKAVTSQVLDEILAVGHHVVPYFVNYTSAQSTKVMGYLPSRNLWVDVRDTWIKG